jgi:hypothetical protein
MPFFRCVEDYVMRSLAVLSVLLAVTAAAFGQEPDVPPRFDVIYNPDLYKQDTPQAALKSALEAISRDRYDYVLAHIIDPAYVDARLADTQAYYERVAVEQIGSTAAGQVLRDAALQARTRELATRMNFRNLADQMRRKIADEPDSLQDLKRMAREGLFQTAGDDTIATLKDVKDRALYFKKVGSRWFLENRKDAAKE